MNDLFRTIIHQHFPNLPVSKMDPTRQSHCTAGENSGESLSPNPLNDSTKSGLLVSSQECGNGAGNSLPGLKEANPVIQPAKQKEAEPELAPDVIEITISEIDRQEAGNFCSTGSCLIATALKNRGLNVACVGTREMFLGDSLDSPWENWVFDKKYGLTELHKDYSARQAPFYGPEVVGKIIRMRKRQ